MIEIKDLSKSLGEKRLFSNINFSINDKNPIFFLF